MKIKILKKLISTICAVCMSVSFAVTSVGAVPQQETTSVSQQSEKDSQIEERAKKFAYSLQWLEKVLPKPEDNRFGLFKSLDYLTISGQLNDEKIYENVKYLKKTQNGTEVEYKNVSVNEKNVYEEIKKVVKGIVNEKGSENKMQIAEAIYIWVTDQIPYDHDSIESVKDTKTNEDVSLRKPQDPLFVFDQKTGVCAGKASLINLMMRLAGIPCASIVSDEHAYNAVYLKDGEKSGREGWTLLDATWAASESDMEQKTGKTENVNKKHRFFPGFYEGNISFKEANIKVLEEGGHTVGNIGSQMRDFELYIEDKYREEDPCYDYFNKIVNKDEGKYGPVEYNTAPKGDVETIYLHAKKGQTAKNIKLLPDILQNGVTFVVAEGIESFVLEGDVDLNFDFTLAKDLKNINTDKSSKYISDEFALYERDSNDLNKKGKVIHLFNKETQVIGNNGLSYKYHVDAASGKLEYILLFGNEGLIIDEMQIPEEIRMRNVPVKIGRGIKSLVLQDDDTVDLYDAEDLENIDVKKSNKYMLDEGKLYEKDKDRHKGKEVPMYDPNLVETCDMTGADDINKIMSWFGD